jgi:undecaprenyl-diphosphatase
LQVGDGWLSLVTRAVLVWALVFGTVLGIGWMLTHPLRGSVGEEDDELAHWLADRRTPLLSDLAEVGQVPGDTITGQVVLLAIAVLFSVWQRSVVPGVLVVLVDAGHLGIYLATTALVPRDRPPVRILDPGLVANHSFPSGHVATATAICGCIVVLTWAYTNAGWWVTPLLLVPVLTAATRAYQGAHHLSDVLVTLLYAATWVASVTLLMRRPSSQ